MERKEEELESKEIKIKTYLSSMNLTNKPSSIDIGATIRSQTKTLDMRMCSRPVLPAVASDFADLHGLHAAAIRGHLQVVANSNGCVIELSQL